MNRLPFFGTALAAGAMLAFAFTARAQNAPTLAKEVLTVEVGDYRVDFRGQAAWTLGNISYKKVPILSYTGANQTVVNLKTLSQGPESWVGSSHGGEVIESVVLEVDGKPYSIKEGLDAPIGQEYAVVRETQIGPFQARTRVTVSEAGIHQTFSFLPSEETDRARYLYVFMHCLDATMTEWLAIEPNGNVIVESFPSEKTNSFKRDASMIALYSPKTMTGAVISYPTPYEGEPGFSNFLINWPDRHNKHYLRMKPGAVAGKEFSCWIKGFFAESSEWQKQATEIHQATESR